MEQTGCIPGTRFTADEGKKGTLFYRLVISPDPRCEDSLRDLDLRELTIQTMVHLEERLKTKLLFAAVEGGGKDGNIYVVDTANMGHFKAPTGQVMMDCPNPNAVQAIMGPQSHGRWKRGQVFSPDPSQPSFRISVCRYRRRDAGV